MVKKANQRYLEHQNLMKIHFSKKKKKNMDENNLDVKTIANCAVKASYDLGAKLIVVFTYSGQSA